MSTWCGGCDGAAREDCRNSLAHAGVIKAHWECWSDCNLHCPFCFRTTYVPVVGDIAMRVVDALATGGVRVLSFAGGDPTLRSDLGTLIRHARTLGMRTEVQTNAQLSTERAWLAISHADRVCLSLDGPTHQIHDTMRLKPGNFARVIAMANKLDQAKIPFTVRTVATRLNVDSIPRIADIVAQLEMCEIWTLLEFTPVNEGFRNRHLYTLDSQHFEELVRELRSLDIGRTRLDIFRTAEKVGAYMQITASGLVYGTTRETFYETGRPQPVASLLTDHISEIASSLPLNVDGHRARYSSKVTQRNLL